MILSIEILRLMFLFNFAQYKYILPCFSSAYSTSIMNESSIRDRKWYRKWTCWCPCRLINSPLLVAAGLSVGYETWHPIGWNQRFMIDRSEYRLGNASVSRDFGLTWPHRFPNATDSPLCTALTAGKCLPLGLCKETVKECKVHGRMGLPEVAHT